MRQIYCTSAISNEEKKVFHNMSTLDMAKDKLSVDKMSLAKMS